MRKTIYGLLAFVMFTLVITSCTNVKPNFEGVLMQNYGKNGKADFSLQKGSVNTSGMGTALYQVPLYEQRVTFAQNPDENMRVLHLKCADNTEVTCHPVFSFRVIEARAVDVVFENKQLDHEGNEFMAQLVSNILDVKIYDIMKKESREWTTDSLMATGGQLKFEKAVEEIVKAEFLKKGLELMTWSCQLDYSDAVRGRIDERNKVQQNIAVLSQQILEQEKKNELAALKAKENQILSSGLTQQVLVQQMIEKWDGKASFYGGNPIQFVRQVNPQ